VRTHLDAAIVGGIPAMTAIEHAYAAVMISKALASLCAEHYGEMLSQDWYQQHTDARADAGAMPPATEEV